MKKAKGVLGKCDALFSKIVRREGVCEICGRTENIQCCHIISRTYSNTRLVEANAFAGCAKCHLHTHKWPVDMYDFISSHIGMVAYDKLKELALSKKKVNWVHEYDRLKKRAVELRLIPKE